MSELLTKRCLFENLQLNSISISNRQKVFDCSLKFIKNRYSIATENVEDKLVKKLTNFAGHLLDRWNKSDKNCSRFIGKNEQWLDTPFDGQNELGM